MLDLLVRLDLDIVDDVTFFVGVAFGHIASCCFKRSQAIMSDAIIIVRHSGPLFGISIRHRCCLHSSRDALIKPIQMPPPYANRGWSKARPPQRTIVTCLPSCPSSRTGSEARLVADSQV